MEKPLTEEEQELLKIHKNILKEKEIIIFIEVWQDKKFNWGKICEEKITDMGGNIGTKVYACQ